jgi:Cu/Ag efflux protein CusF
MLNLNRAMWLLVSMAILLTACGGSKPSEPAKEFALKGVVMRVDPQVRTAVIKHENIEGWMEAMTMEFPIRDAREFEKLSVGKRIAATVFVAGDEYWLGGIAEVPAADAASETKPAPEQR